MELFVWGTGRLVGKVVGRYIALEAVKAFIDNADKSEYMGKKVLSPETAACMIYDAIVVANLYSREIYCSELRKLLNGLKKSLEFLYAKCRCAMQMGRWLYVNDEKMV